MRAYERLLNYVRIDTQSDPDSAASPSAAKEKDLSRCLVGEFAKLGIKAELTDYGYVYARIPGNAAAPAMGFIAHIDTAPGISGKDVHPRIVPAWDGGDIRLNDRCSLSLEAFPELRRYVGKTLIVTDGTTLLGADDKAGVAEIMTLAEELTGQPELKHGDIWIAFTPDEEIGRGTEHFELSRFPAEFAFTLDGDAVEGIDYENFNAASAVVTVRGSAIHTGAAKGKMINAANVALQFHQALPANERPEYTQGREGFYHLDEMQGTVESARLTYLIRNHDRRQFEEMKRLLIAEMEYLNRIYPEGTVAVRITDTYANMRELFADKQYIIELARKAMRQAGLEPRSTPIRGGTDGASLTYRGLPCPNLGTGGGNYHGRYEYAVAEDMDKAVEVIRNIALALPEMKK